MANLGMKLAPLLLALCMISTIADAQWDPSTQEATSTTTAPTPPPAPPGQMVSETPMPETQQPEKVKAFKPASFAWALGIGVPIVLDVPRDVVRPGANIFFFGGADFGFFIVGGDLGLQWNPIDLNSVPNVSGRWPLTRTGSTELKITRVHLRTAQVGRDCGQGAMTLHRCLPITMPGRRSRHWGICSRRDQPAQTSMISERY